MTLLSCPPMSIMVIAEENRALAPLAWAVISVTAFSANPTFLLPYPVETMFFKSPRVSFAFTNAFSNAFTEAFLPFAPVGTMACAIALWFSTITALVAADPASTPATAKQINLTLQLTNKERRRESYCFPLPLIISRKASSRVRICSASSMV
jgi:hypothetical protein